MRYFKIFFRGRNGDDGTTDAFQKHRIVGGVPTFASRLFVRAPQIARRRELRRLRRPKRLPIQRAQHFAPFAHDLDRIHDGSRRQGARTGFHGAHVIIGTIFLIVCLGRALAGQFNPKQHLGLEFAAWYWHFVDVVWLFLFACIYVWGAGPRIPGVHE